jgi:hypothetical protein
MNSTKQFEFYSAFQNSLWVFDGHTLVQFNTIYQCTLKQIATKSVESRCQYFPTWKILTFMHYFCRCLFFIFSILQLTNTQIKVHLPFFTYELPVSMPIEHSETVLKGWVKFKLFCTIHLMYVITWLRIYMDYLSIRVFTDPDIALSMHILSFIYGSESVRVFFYCLFI